MRLKAENKLDNGTKLMVWWANNKGRGRDNCTLSVVNEGTLRTFYSRDQDNVLATTRTSSWQGDVNFSRDVRKRLGIEGIEVTSAL